MAEMMRTHGPRVGASFGDEYESSYEGGQDKFGNLLEDYRKADGLLGKVSAGGKMAYGALNPLGDASSAGMMDGILRYFMERRRGE